jgi:hypothetical protein
MKNNILLSLFSLLLVCVAAEVVLRTTHVFHARLAWTQPDREIGWRFTPGREFWFLGENDHAITGRINSLGWRDRERSAARAPGTYRVAVLGDSYVEAFQVELDSTFEAVAERRLNVPGAARKFEVMNFGRSGMCTAEELLVFERDVLPCHPDRVVLLFTPQNDMDDVNPATALDPVRPFFHEVAGDSLALDTSFKRTRNFRIRTLINPLKERSALVSLLVERYNSARQARALARAKATTQHANPQALTPQLRMCTHAPDPVFAGNYLLCKKLMVRMARECAAHGVRFTLAAGPLVYQPYVVKRLRMVDRTFDPDFFDTDLGALADSTGFDFITVTAPFRARTEATGRLLHWSHWNYEGHRVFGKLLADAIGAGATDGGAR